MSSLTLPSASIKSAVRTTSRGNRKMRERASRSHGNAADDSSSTTEAKLHLSSLRPARSRLNQSVGHSLRNPAPLGRSSNESRRYTLIVLGLLVVLSALGQTAESKKPTATPAGEAFRFGLRAVSLSAAGRYDSQSFRKIGRAHV